MAEISFEAYVQDRDGKRLRVSEQYRKKNQDTDQWETTGYGDYTVWLRSEDAAPEIGKGSVVLVQGRLQITKTEKSGTTYTNLNVNASAIGLVRQTGSGGASSTQGHSGAGADEWGRQTTRQARQRPSRQYATPSASAQPTPIYEDTPPF